MAGQLQNVFSRSRMRSCRCSKVRFIRPTPAEQQGWIRAKWAESDSGRQAKFYSLTAAGRAQLEKEKESWSRLSNAINLVVEGA